MFGLSVFPTSRLAQRAVEPALSWDHAAEAQVKMYANDDWRPEALGMQHTNTEDCAHWTATLNVTRFLSEVSSKNSPLAYCPLPSPFLHDFFGTGHFQLPYARN